MAWCWSQPSHFLNQCWLLISDVLWHLPKSNFSEYPSHLVTESITQFLCSLFPPSFSNYWNVVCTFNTTCHCHSALNILNMYMIKALNRYFCKIINFPKREYYATFCSDSPLWAIQWNESTQNNNRIIKWSITEVVKMVISYLFIEASNTPLSPATDSLLTAADTLRVFPPDKWLHTPELVSLMGLSGGLLVAASVTSSMVWVLRSAAGDVSESSVGRQSGDRDGSCWGGGTEVCDILRSGRPGCKFVWLTLGGTTVCRCRSICCS